MLTAFAVATPVWAQVPFAQVVSGNQQRFTLLPSVRTVYDSNVLRDSDDQAGPKDNVRVTPGVDLTVRRDLGRISIDLTGSAGYDFNSRFKFLNRTRIEAASGITARIGGRCRLDADLSYEQSQFDIADTNQIAGATRRDQDYELVGTCPRSAGFSPVLAGSVARRTNGGNGLLNSESVGGRFGLAYALPSLGTLTLWGAVSRLSRPNIEAVLGFADGTDIRSVQLALERSVSPRIQLNLGAGYVRARPDRASVAPFGGASFDGQITLTPVPRLAITGSAVRRVTNQTGISATYVISETFTAGATWQLTAKSAVAISLSRIARNFRGETIAIETPPIGADRTNFVSANYSLNLLRNLRLGAAISRRWRRADNPIYDYAATIASLSVGARF